MRSQEFAFHSPLATRHSPLTTHHSDGLCRRGRVEGSCLVNRPMPVRIRPSALPEREAPLECDGRHATLRRSKSRFDSWQGHGMASHRPPRVWRKARRSSKPPGWVRLPGGERSSSGCDGIAHDPAKVEDQVRLLARTCPMESESNSRPGTGRATGSARGKNPARGGCCPLALTCKIDVLPQGVSCVRSRHVQHREN
jgi:hypothetical protein